MEKLRKICWLEVNEDGLFTLWDDCQPNTQPKIFSRDELGNITVEEIPDLLPEQKHARLAAAFAISNMGQEVPNDVGKGNFLEWERSSRHAVDNLAGHLMETDEHEEIFAEEAEMWDETIQRDGVQRMFRVHAKTCPWFEEILIA